MSNQKINWVKVMEDNRDAIEETIKLAKEETFNTMQGWHVDIEIDENGKVWTTELFSHGSHSMSSHKGETFIVCRVNSWEIELDESEDIKHEEVLYPEFLAQKDDDDGYENASEFMQAKYPDILQEWVDNARDFEISEFDASELLDNAIEEQRAYHQFD